MLFLVCFLSFLFLFFALFVCLFCCPTKQKDRHTLESAKSRAARYDLSNYTSRTPGSVTPMLKHLRRLAKSQAGSSQYQRWHRRRRAFKPLPPLRSKNDNTVRLFQEFVRHPDSYLTFHLPRLVMSTSITSALSLESFWQPPQQPASHTSSLAFRYRPPNAARIHYASGEELVISAQLSIDAVSAL